MQHQYDPALEQRLYNKLMDLFIKFAMVLALATICFTIFAPFMTLMLWALILAVTLYPLHLKLVDKLHGQQGKSAAIIALAGILLIVAPTISLGNSLGDTVSNVVHGARDGTLVIPQPAESVASIPLIGKKLYPLWQQAANDLPALIKSQQPKIGELTKTVMGMVASMGGGLLKFVFAFIVAAIIMTFGEAGAKSSLAIANRIVGQDRGPKLTKLCTATIRAVAQGVIGVAFIQALLAGIGMSMAGVPASGVLFVIALILGIAQVPVILVTGPAIAWLWMAGDMGNLANIFYTVVLAVAGMADNVLKPLLLGRGVDAPMPVILMGAIGGMASSGILGMFIGATMLAIGYQIFMAWVHDDERYGQVESEHDVA